MSAPRELARRLAEPRNVARLLGVLRQTRFLRGHRRVLLRAAGAWMGGLLGGRRPLKVAELSVGSACQLRCEHCYATDVTEDPVDLVTVREWLDALRAEGCLGVMLVGGEPTLRRDLGDIVLAIRERAMLPFVFTNGQRLDRDRLIELRRAGLFGLLYSVLGAGEEHDRFVGRSGAFVRLLDSLDEAVRLGFFVSLNTTPTHEMIGNGGFDELEQLAARRGIPLKFNYPALLGRWAGRDDQLLDDRERSTLRGRLRAGRVSNDMATSFVGGVCPAGHFAIYVTDRGEVTPCAYIPLSFGSLREEPLPVILDRMRRSPVFSALHRQCLVGEDRGFIERIIRPTVGAADLPMRWDRHPLRREIEGAAAATVRGAP